jgi:hypothetical protein
MLKFVPPATWDGYGSQITPEKLNRNLLAAQQQLEDYAEQQWRRWSAFAPLANTIALPAITDSPYVVERITIYGEYTGQPTLTFGTETFLLPPNGFDGEFYSGTVLPGFLVTGTNYASTYNISVSGSNTTLFAVIGLRSSRSPNASTVCYSANLATWSDGEVLSPSKFDLQLTDLGDFASNWTAGAQQPDDFGLVVFPAFTTATAEVERAVKMPGSGGCQIVKILGTIHLAVAGVGGQTVRVSYGFNTATNNVDIDVDGETAVNFSIIPTPPATFLIEDTSRLISSSADDLVLILTNSIGGSNVSYVHLYVVTQKTV